MNYTNTNSFQTRFLLVSVLALALLSCSEEQMDETDLSESVTVEAVELRVGALPLVHRTTGELRARNQVDIYPEISARITEIMVNDGDCVSEGDTLLRFRDVAVREQLNQAEYDHQIARAQLRQSEADLRRLQAQFKRVRELRERELETELELETLQADIDAAEASVDLSQSQMERAASQVEEQKSNLENTVIQSPVSGVVGSRNAEVGQRVDTGTQLFRVGDTDNMRAHVMLTERMSSIIEQGDRAEIITSSGLNNPAEATVERISPFLDPVTHTTIAQLSIEKNSAGLQPGMFVTIDIFYGETDQTTLIPKTALYDHPVEGETGIYLADMSILDRELEFENGEDSQTRRVSPAQVPVRFVPVTVIAEGRGVAGIEEIDNSDHWVVTIGQNQLAEWDREEAYIRMETWEKVMELQNMQARDMEQIIFGDNSSN